MANKRPKPEEIVSKLRQVEVLMGQGMPRLDAIRQIGVVEQTYYRWRKQYGGMGVDQLKELRRLQKENERLRRAVSDLTLDKLILTEASKGNFQAPLVAVLASLMFAASSKFPSAVHAAYWDSTDPRKGVFHGADPMKNSWWPT
ncbi:Transposase [Ruegeria atlantica]|uniref:Transposase n=2 Tax=Ruegeria atlantica TaxID=81569 RepID=A0A0P1EF58_9RHOB|nr:Transposase [Ruegeria atlantica]